MAGQQQKRNAEDTKQKRGKRTFLPSFFLCALCADLFGPELPTTNYVLLGVRFLPVGFADYSDGRQVFGLQRGIDSRQLR